MSADGKRMFVTNAWSDNVSVIDTAALQIVQTLPIGAEPSGVVLDKEGTTLYVANRLSGDVSVIDLKSGQETKRLPCRAWRKLPGTFSRREMDLLHAHLSKCRCLSEPAKV